MCSVFRYQPVVAVFGSLGGKLPAVDDVCCPTNKKLSNTSLDGTCLDFELQTDCNYHIDLRQTFSALEMKNVKVCGYETYNTEEFKKSTEKAKADEGKTAEEEQEAPGALVTHVNNKLHSFFSI